MEMKSKAFHQGTISGLLIICIQRNTDGQGKEYGFYLFYHIITIKPFIDLLHP